MKHIPPPQGEPVDAPSILPSDITPQDVPVAIGRLRKEARDEIHRLIDFLDTTDNYSSRELEDQVDDGPVDDIELEGDDTKDGRSADDEPSLGSGATGEWSTQAHWASPNDGSDREGDGCADDREGDELQHGADEHDGGEPDEDGEPSLGWTNEGSIETPCSLTDGEQGEAARAPQNRTTVAPSVDQMRKLRSRFRGGYLDRCRFDKAMPSVRKPGGGDVLRGGELSFPGGQQAFDEMLRRRDKVTPR